MKTITVKPLTVENFKFYGAFSGMINPKNWPKLGEEPCEFYRDMNILDLGGSTSVAFSVTRACKRPMIIDNMEFHRGTGEGILPIDGDIIMQLAPATQGDYPNVDEIVAFIIPKGTMVTLRPGVWHAGSFAHQTDVVNMLIALPERVYSDDCFVTKLNEQDIIEITL